MDAKDGLYYKPQTTLAGIVGKHTGKGDFDAPKVQLDAINALRSGKKTPYIDPSLGDVPVNFLSTVDTTGGNSGSPTLNGKGELVGLLFDGTYESVASNFLFDPATTRSIHVDSRYMLWNMAEVDGAINLLQEMSIPGLPGARCVRVPRMHGGFRHRAVAARGVRIRGAFAMAVKCKQSAFVYRAKTSLSVIHHWRTNTPKPSRNLKQ